MIYILYVESTFCSTVEKSVEFVMSEVIFYYILKAHFGLSFTIIYNPIDRIIRAMHESGIPI